jgi:large subunit ribosomal protein L4
MTHPYFSLMKADLFTSAGKKKGTVDLPSLLFDAPINEGLMHFALLMQQSNRRAPIAHTKSRGEVQGSTRKLFRQKGTGRARRGSIRANILRGGAKAFGPKNNRNFTIDMPQKMRRRALFSCLSQAATDGKVLVLEGYGDDHKTKSFINLLSALPVSAGRKIVFVMPSPMEALERGASNVPGVKTILAQYLNFEDVLGAHHLVFLVDALKVAEATFGRNQKSQTNQKTAVSFSSQSSASS